MSKLACGPNFNFEVDKQYTVEDDVAERFLADRACKVVESVEVAQPMPVEVAQPMPTEDDSPELEGDEFTPPPLAPVVTRRGKKYHPKGGK